jgi:hypothetical protein
MTRASWIGSKAKPEGTAPPARPRRQASGLSFRTVLRARGISPANAFVESMNDDECVLQCVLLLDVDSPIEFDAQRSDGTPYAVHGTIRSRVAIPPRFEYVVELEHQAMPVVGEGADEGTRRRLRLEFEFPLQYRTPKEGFKNARARNVSTGGLLITCREALVESMLLELHFVLPSHVLNVYPERSTVFDILGGFKRRSIPSKRRRPFEDLVVAGRVVHRRPLGNGLVAYGVSFSNMERHAREEIQRFVEAVRHVKVRQKP